MTIQAHHITNPHESVAIVYKWAGVTEKHTLLPVVCPVPGEKSVMVEVPEGGGFGGGSVRMKGTINPDVPAVYALWDEAHADVIITTPGLYLIRAHAYAIVPELVGATGALLDVYLMINRGG